MDLPLEQDDVGARFVTFVVFMMTVLATLAIGGALVISELRSSWMDAVKGQLTIEIPATDGKGSVRSAAELSNQAEKIRDALKAREDVSNVRVLSRGEVENLVKPWLGEDVDKDELPLPALMGITLKNGGDITAIKKATVAIDPQAGIETHQSWLSDLRKFSLVLLLASAAMAAIVIACCILTVAGAVKARLAAHHNDIDLLHVMGATDGYIGGQFTRVVVQSVGRAALLGTAIGLILLKTAGAVAGELQSAMLPAFHWDGAAWAWFIALPALVTALCFSAARFTVLRTLRIMP